MVIFVFSSGSKYGIYGSFLPTHERVPSVLHQEKPPNTVAGEAYGRARKSPSEGIVEVVCSLRITKCALYLGLILYW